MNLVSLLEKHAAGHPDQPALIDRAGGHDRVVSFGELARRVAAGSAWLGSNGLRRGQTALVFQPVSIELYEFILASFHRGLRVMLADPSAGGAFLSLCCERLRPDAFFGPWKAQCLRLAVPALRHIRKPVVSGCWFPGALGWRTDGASEDILDVPDDEPALITFTSGSTGVPKAAVRTHGFLLAQHRALARSLEFDAGGVDLVTLPVFVLANLASGMTSVLAATDLARPGSPDAEAIHAQCGRHRVTRCTASPAFFEGLLKSPSGMPRFRQIFTGGAPVFPDLLDRLAAALPEAGIHSVYGSTEAEPISHFSANEWSDAVKSITRLGGGLCAGEPVEEIRLRVIRDHWGKPLGPMNLREFQDIEVPQGQAGEIVVSGRHVLHGYLDGIGDGETKIQVGDAVWHRTGDAGWIDDRGRIWLLGRCSEKLPYFPAPDGLPDEALRYPFAVETSLRELAPMLRTAAVMWNGRRILAVGGRCGDSEPLRARASGLGIQEIVHLDTLPLDRRHNAKIDYPALRRMLGGKIGG